MSDQAPNLMKHRPFQIVWVWDTLCIIASVFVFLKTENVPAMVGIILLGAIPLVVVIMRFSMAQQKAASAGTRDAVRSKDIVQ